jgi:endonuclease YncB( thermonuclease family)
MLALTTTAAAAAPFSARVVAVTDGDTLKVLRDGRVEVVRLQGIDAPETGQAYGTRAKQVAAQLAFSQTVTVHPTGRDRNGRLLAEITLPNGRSLNQAMVRAGYAWWFRRYSTDARLAAAEAEARGAQVGLWADPRPMPPWEWRAAGQARRRPP